MTSSSWTFDQIQVQFVLIRNFYCDYIIKITFLGWFWAFERLKIFKRGRIYKIYFFIFISINNWIYFHKSFFPKIEITKSLSNPLAIHFRDMNIVHLVGHRSVHPGVVWKPPSQTASRFFFSLIFFPLISPIHHPPSFSRL